MLSFADKTFPPVACALAAWWIRCLHRLLFVADHCGGNYWRDLRAGGEISRQEIDGSTSVVTDHRWPPLSIAVWGCSALGPRVSLQKIHEHRILSVVFNLHGFHFISCTTAHCAPCIPMNNEIVCWSYDCNCENDSGRLSVDGHLIYTRLWFAREIRRYVYVFWLIDWLIDCLIDWVYY